MSYRMVDLNQATADTPRQRLRRADRLCSSKDYRRMNRTGSRQAGRHFVLQTAPGRDPERSRLGLVVSRKVGNAVARNHVKRRVREWFRHNRALLGAAQDVVVLARAGAARLDGKAIDRELTKLVAR